MLSLAIATASSSSVNVSTVSTGPNDSSWVTDIVAGAAVEDRRQVVEAVGQRRVVGRARRRSGARRPRRARARRTPRPCRGARRWSAARSRPCRRTGRRAGSRSARSTSPSTNSSWIDSSTTSRAPAEQTWPECRKTAVSAKSRATSRSASAKTMLGFLPPSSSATFFTVAGGGRHQPPAGLQAAGEGDQVDPGVGRRAARRRVGAGAEDEVADAGRQAGLLEQPHQVDRGVRRQLAGLEDEGVAGREAGRDLPGDLEERVVPRRDQRADADRLVHDPADDVGVAGVDHPAGVLGRDPAVVAEDRDHVGDVVAGSRPGACRCRATPSGPGPRRRARAGRPAAAAGRRARGPRCPARARRGRRGAPRRSRPRCPRRRPRRPRRPGVPSAGQRISRRAPPRALTHAPSR